MTTAKTKPKTKKPRKSAAAVEPNSEVAADSPPPPVEPTAPPPPAMPRFNSAAVGEAAEKLKLLSDRTRLGIALILAETPGTNVTDLCRIVGYSQPAVSHHLALLRHSGMIAPVRAGKHNEYTLTDKGHAVTTVVRALACP